MIPRFFSLLFLAATLSASCCLAQAQDQTQHQLQKEPTLESAGFLKKKAKIELQEVEVLDIASEGEITITTDPIHLPLNRSLKLSVYHTVYHGYNSLYGYIPALSNEQFQFDFNKESTLDSTVITANDDDEDVDSIYRKANEKKPLVIFSPKAKGTTILEYHYIKTPDNALFSLVKQLVDYWSNKKPKTGKTIVRIPLIVEDPDEFEVIEQGAF